MMGHHFSTSALWNAASPSGVTPWVARNVATICSAAIGSLAFSASSSPYAGLPLQIQLGSSQAQTAFDAITLNANAAVPEPSSALLFALGLAGFARRRFGRRATRRP